jgi:hypothetical protein
MILGRYFRRIAGLESAICAVHALERNQKGLGSVGALLDPGGARGGRGEGLAEGATLNAALRGGGWERRRYLIMA